MSMIHIEEAPLHVSDDQLVNMNECMIRRIAIVLE